MAKAVIKEGTILAANYDLSGQTNESMLEISNPPLDVTNFGSNGWKEFLPGLIEASGTMSGFLETGTDFDADQLTGLSGIPILIGLNNPLVIGDEVHCYKANQTSYSRRHSVGEAAGWAGNFIGDGAASQANVLKILAAKTASADEAGQNLRATAAGQRVYAYLWVTAASGTSPTLDVTIESDATDAWVGAETTRFTFTQETDATAGYQVATPINGAITDTWWRVSATIAGTSPSFTFAVALGIG